MGRHRKPSNVLDAAGAFKKNPNRSRSDPKTKGEIGRAPAYLSKTEQKAWRDIVKQAPHGVLTGSDRIMVETAARYLAEARDGWSDMSAANRTGLVGVMGRLGLSPADRAKIAMPGDDDDDPFADL